ncbi:bifunctional acetate--CoA ligase family protein/GNAT family N-acetyltransferase [Cobetia sp. L2A1]|uniref:bifunctional acetate--CoA ligase family protein/GNAT family N-acetyltransferase n=1 Tax=Cobetia sp. L2A1 TaxID=2686360 RepID=UPI00131B1D91|nr:bifunctional acetate--CoA ligase family protein/GNAT family N-acetyltransferase [Cobetia sp. L2A1]
MSTRFLRNFFEPRSVAVIGASEKMHSLGGQVLRNLLEGGFKGTLEVVNPKGYETVHGVNCVRRVSDLSQVPDLAILCSPAETLPKMVEKLGRFGVKAALLISGGVAPTPTSSFARATEKGLGMLTGRDARSSVSETPRFHSDQGDLNSRLLKAARASGIRLLGPECMGVCAPHNHLNASFSGQPVAKGKVAYLGQSGMLGNAMIDWAAGRGIGFSHLVTLGDSVDVMLPDLIDYLNQYGPSQALLLHLERIHDAMHFMTALREASRNRLVLAIKSGRTPEADLFGTHVTPGVPNRDRIVDAALARAGVVRVNDSEDMFDALETLNRMKPLRGDRLAIVSNGLGPALLAIDKLMAGGGKLAELSEDSRLALLKGELDVSLPGRNPVDLGGNATPEDFVAAVNIVANDHGVDAVLVVHAPTRLAPSRVTAEALIAHRKQFRRNLLTSWMGLEQALAARHECHLAGIPTYLSPEKGVKAFLQMVDYHRVQSLLQQTPPSLSFSTTGEIRACAHDLVHSARRAGREWLTHSETAHVLETYGITTAPSRYVADASEGARAVQELQRSARQDDLPDRNGPYALRVVHEHNSQPFRYRRYPQRLSSGVVQDLAGPEDIALAIRRITNKVAERDVEQGRSGSATTRIHEFCLQPMQRGKHSLQLSAGITRDDEFGPVVVFGLGGYKVNVLADRQVALPPLNMTLARELISRSHASRLIAEHSPDPERDFLRLCTFLVKLAQLASDLPDICGLEINPLLLNRDEAVAVDFTLDLGKPARFAIMPYPEELRESFQLESGMQVEVRPIRGEDAPLITAFHARLSEESIRFRYFHHKADLSQRDLALLAQINYDRQMAFIAERDVQESSGDAPRREMLGVVRVWNDPDNIRTEFSVIIRDDLQGEGIGRLLMEKMLRYCRSLGTLEMVGKIMIDNHPMRALMKHLGFTCRYNMEEQVIDASIRLNEPMNDWQRLRLESKA